jgi:hypothetical protein
MSELSLPQESIFAAALELKVADRPAFLDRACAGNPMLCAEVEELLRVHDRTGDLLNVTQAQVAACDAGAAILPELPDYDLVAFRGDHALATTLFTEAAAGFDAADMLLDSAAARRSLGMLLGGADGRAMVTQADSWMSAQNIRNPVQMTAMLTPGLAGPGSCA